MMKTNHLYLMYTNIIRRLQSEWVDNEKITPAQVGNVIFCHLVVTFIHLFLHFIANKCLFVVDCGLAPAKPPRIVLIFKFNKLKKFE